MSSILLCNDCRNALKSIPDASVDALLTDPPYGTNDGKGKIIRRGKTDTSFGVIEWDKNVPLDYLSEIYRVLRDDRWGVIFTDNMYVTDLWKALEGHGLSPRNTFYWIKHNKAPTPRKNFKSCVETAVVFTKGRTTIKWRGGANQNNYIVMPFVSGKEKVPHPTQKPVALMRHLCTLFTDEGDVVLDPFMGSGSTGVACVRENRQFVGIEINPDYHALATQRVREVERELNVLHAPEGGRDA